MRIIVALIKALAIIAVFLIIFFIVSLYLTTIPVFQTTGEEFASLNGLGIMTAFIIAFLPFFFIGKK